MNGSIPAGSAQKSSTDKALELAGKLIISIAQEDDKHASRILRQIRSQKSVARVLIVLAVIAAGALHGAHGDKWKAHLTDYPEQLNQEEE